MYEDEDRFSYLAENADLDQVIEFTSVTDSGGVERVSIFRLYRQLYQRTDHCYELHQTRYGFKKNAKELVPLDDKIDLEGFWGRAEKLQKVSWMIFGNLDCVRLTLEFTVSRGPWGSCSPGHDV